MATSTFGQQIAKPIKDTYQETIEPDVSTFDLATVVTPNPTKYKVAIMWLSLIHISEPTRPY